MELTDHPDFAHLRGKTLTEISMSPEKDEIMFVTDRGERFVQYHSQYCCESVEVAEIVGDLRDLIGSPILLAEEVIHENETPEGVSTDHWLNDSYTWTFYKLATNRGRVTIRWLGTSNGYYSESVDFRRAA